MSESDTVPRTVTMDEVTVTKRYEPDEFPVRVVSFEVRSDRDDSTVVRLVDPVPDEIDPADLGFNTEYEGECWAVENGSAVFERRIEPNETLRTVYGVRDTDVDPAAFMAEPALDVESSAERAEADVGHTNGSMTGRSTERTAHDVDPSGIPASDGADVGFEDGVGAALAAELRDGGLDETDRKFLANELGGNDAGREVRIAHLQSRISDLEAYTDALEGFIDENGPARQLLADMTDRFDTIEADIEALDERTAANRAAIERLDDHAESNSGAIDALETGLTDTDAEVTETRDSVADLRADVEAIEDWRERIANVLGGASAGEDD